jgi:hypothetical protein
MLFGMWSNDTTVGLSAVKVLEFAFQEDLKSGCEIIASYLPKLLNLKFKLAEGHGSEVCLSRVISLVKDLDQTA